MMHDTPERPSGPTGEDHNSSSDMPRRGTKVVRPLSPIHDGPSESMQKAIDTHYDANEGKGDTADSPHVVHLSTKLVRSQTHRHFYPKRPIEWVIFAIIILCIIGGGIGIYLLTASKSTPKKQPAPQASQQTPPKTPAPQTHPTTVAAPLTGLPVSPAAAKRPVTGVMIENSLLARPQSGLKSAGIVFEALTEGGITRFLALYQAAQPSYIGPVRSARPYFLDFLMPFQASLAHVGGSPTALKQIQQLHVRNLDEFYNGAAYWRISTRYAPHNMYTSMANLDALNKSKGYTSSTFVPFPRKPDAPSSHPTATSINLNVSGYYYNVHYAYDAATNSYNRSEGGQPHLDFKTKTQLSPKVVIALVMHWSHMSDGYHSQYQTVGSGPMYVFQDGTVTQGTWHKASRESQFTFTTGNGTPIKLNAGQTWITIVGSSSEVTYK